MHIVKSVLSISHVPFEIRFVRGVHFLFADFFAVLKQEFHLQLAIGCKLDAYARLMA